MLTLQNSRSWTGASTAPQLPVAQGRQVAIVLIGLIMIGFVWLGIFYHLCARENTIRQQAHRDVLNLSVALEKHVQRLLVSADQVMRFIADDLAHNPETFDFQAWMRRSTSLEEIANQISFYNELGELLGSRSPLAPGTPRFNVRDRAYFQALAANPDLGLYVDRTMRGRITGRYVLQTARRYNRPDGSFGGVIVTSINPDYLAQQFASLDVGQQGSVAVLGQDGFLRARFPQTEGMYERNVTTMRAGKDLLSYLRESPAGTYEVESGFDGVSRIIGYRAVGTYPLIVTVGKSVNEVLAPFHVERARAIAIGLLMTALLLGVLLTLVLMLRRDREQRLQLAATNQTLMDQKEAAQVAADEARHANRLLTLAAQMAHVGHWRLDLPSNVLTWSDEVFRTFGLDPAAGVPSLRDAVDAYHPEDRDKVACFISDSIHEGSDYEFSARALRPDGNLREVICRGCCEIGPDGHVAAVFGTILDVTAMRASERAVRESEARYRLLAENTRDMIAQVDFDTTRRYVSPASRRLLGYEPEELVGTKSLDMVHIDDQPVVRAVMTDLASGARRSAVQRKRYRRKDGRYVWVEVGYQVFHDEAERPVGCIACARDITDNIEAEHRLTESEQRFRLLAENTSELIILGHDDGRRSYISPAAKRLLGFTPDELGAMRLRDHVHPEDLSHFYAATARSMQEGEVSCVYRALNKDRGWIWVEGVFRRIPDAVGNEPTIVATFRDVSEREAQAEALHQAKEAAEQASQAKTDFLATMSHEIRTPLNAIIGFTDILVGSGRLEPDLQRQAELVRTSGVTLLTIVNDILDFSKVEAGAIELAVEPFALRSLIDNSVAIVRGIATSKHIQVRTIIDDKLPASLLGDEARLRQVLLNLLNNAVKFTPAGSVTLMIREDGGAMEGVRLHFSVTDTGIGIPKAKQERLFQRFSQVDGSVHRTYGGTGLGLAICKQLVELMGGEIGLHSEEHRGSMFWFNVTLPSATLQSALEPVTEAPKPHRKGRLLLVEDVAINQEVARTVLEAAGHEVEIVGDGAAAVQAVQTKSFDLVLMDIQMPGMDGVTATRLIRRLPDPLGLIPVIAMTANVLPDELRRFREAGMNDHVAKPFNRVELYTEIDRWLSVDAAAGALMPKSAMAH